MKTLVEICVDSVESACIAQDAGAARIELCSALSEGGLTPSLGMITTVRSNVDIKVHVIIRPRAGDFLYTGREFGVMCRDIDIAGEAGADGIVTGVLLADGGIDVERTALMVEYAAPMSVTFHRAFDMCRDPRKALSDVIEAGADRLLTSGQAQKAIDGASLIRDLVEAAGNRIIIMPGSGIDEYNIALLAKTTLAKEFHLSGRSAVESEMRYKRKKISMGGINAQSEYSYKVADAEKIRNIIKILQHIDI